MEFVLKTDTDQLVGSSIKKHNFDISNLLLKLSGIFRMIKRSVLNCTSYFHILV